MRLQIQRGYSLVELMIVIAVLATIAAIVVPATSSISSTKLDVAAEQYASAIRYSRSESIRTGEQYGFHELSAEKLIELFRLDLSTSPATLIFDVIHPISKSTYFLDLDLHSLAAADTLSRTIDYAGTCNQINRIYFDRNGSPWCSSPTTVRMDKYELTMQSGNASRIITLDGITGRVTVQ